MTMAPRSPKGILRRVGENAALALLGCLVALGLGEAAARLAWVEPPPPESRPAPPPGLPVVKSVENLRKPNVRGIHQGVLYQTNRFGFRDRAVSREPPPGVFRIVVVGDSFTMGQGVLAGESYPKVLERLLNQGGNGSFEVLNLGLSAQSIFGVFRRLVSIGLQLKPDLIVYGLTLNDIKGPAYRRTLKKFAFVRQNADYNRYRQSPSRLLRVLWPRIQSMRELMFPPEGSHLAELLLNYDEETDAWKRFSAGLRRFGTVQTNSKTPVVVFVHTNLFYLNSFHPFLGIYEQIERAAAQQGLGVIQSFPSFRGEDPRSVTISAADFHPNRRGHELLAKGLLDGLRDMGLVEASD